VSFDWLAEPEPIGSAYEGIIFVLLGLSALAGAGMGYYTASETVRSVPFCEQCGKHMEPESLWCLPPVQGPRAVQAFQALNYKEIAQLPQCSMFDNFISVEVWSCTCDSKSILELVGHGVASSCPRKTVTNRPSRIPCAFSPDPSPPSSSRRSRRSRWSVFNDFQCEGELLSSKQEA